MQWETKGSLLMYLEASSCYWMLELDSRIFRHLRRLSISVISFHSSTFLYINADNIYKSCTGVPSLIIENKLK